MMLGTLPVECLRLPNTTVETLNQLGVYLVEELLQLPRDGLAVRLGDTLMQRLDQASGQLPEVIVAHRPPPNFSAQWSLEHPTDRRDAIETMLSELTKRMTSVLAQHDHAAVQVEAVLETDSGNQVGSEIAPGSAAKCGQKRCCRLQVTLFQPTRDPAHIDSLLRLQMETIRIDALVQRVCVSAVTTVRLRGEQRPLWLDAEQGATNEVALLVERLSSRLGKAAIFCVQTQAGALPEQAYRRRPFLKTKRSATRANGIKKHEITENQAIKPRRPLWLHEPPAPLRYHHALQGRSSHQPPTCFQYRNTLHHVAHHAGPERIETGWWRGHSIRRDYYQIETTEGFQFWVFRRLTDGAWFLHGCFE